MRTIHKKGIVDITLVNKEHHYFSVWGTLCSIGGGEGPETDPIIPVHIGAWHPLVLLVIIYSIIKMPIVKRTLRRRNNFYAK